MRPGGATGIADAGGERRLSPEVSQHARPHAEAVVINTGGGVVGGDRIKLDFSVQEGSDATITTQAAERIYRSTGPDSEIDGAPRRCRRRTPDLGAQETILFSGARLRRSYEVDVAPAARLLFAESMIFGRAASGEVMERGALQDRWRIRRGGRLVFAESVGWMMFRRVFCAAPAILGAARALACILYVAPDAEARLASVREVLESAGVDAAASAWNGMLVVRVVSDAGTDMRRAMVRVMQELSGASMPRVWSS